ncbi:MAG: peptidylprolyl isomerase [Eggerthellaceae bacterium]|nr:peptidylprolyl isomerase [Eggerthellaceae bacterium]
MKTSKFLKSTVTVGIAAAFAISLAACSGGSTGAAAATVNGVEIPESQVTETIESVRAQSGLDTEETWGQFLVSNNMTPESVREQIIDSFVNQELIKEGAAELGVTVDSAEVDTYVDSMKANFGDDKAWAEALEQAGFTEESYRESIESSLMQQGVSAHFEESAEPSDEDVLSAAQMYAPYYSGAKRSSHILFDAGDEATANDVLARINSGELDFADAAKQYSKDSSAENGGDVGWDRMTTFVTEYQEALDGLEVGQVSGLVASNYGIHIIKCTDEFTAPDEITSIDALPVDFQETIKSMAVSTKASSDYQAWLDGLEEAANIVINPMPADVPYNIDLTKYEQAAEEAASAESASGEASQDETSSTSSESAEKE